MKEKTVYICEHCDAEYDTVAEAFKCECHGNNINSINKIIEYFEEQSDEMCGWIILKNKESDKNLLVYPKNICIHKKVTDCTDSCFDTCIKIESENDLYEFNGDGDLYEILGCLGVKYVFEKYHIVPNEEYLEKFTGIKIKDEYVI